MGDAFHERILMQVCSVCFPDEEIVTKQKLFGLIGTEVRKIYMCTPKFKKDGGYKNRQNPIEKTVDVLHEIPPKAENYYKDLYNNSLQNFKQLWMNQEVKGYHIDKTGAISTDGRRPVNLEDFLKVLIPHILGKDCSLFYLKEHLTLSFNVFLALIHRMQKEKELGLSLQDTLDLFAAYASIVSLNIRNMCGVCGFDLFINQKFGKFGLEPDEFENVVLIRYFKFCKKQKLEHDTRSKIFDRIQKCIKLYLPRQNTTNNKMDARKRHAIRAYELFWERHNSPPPAEMEKKDIERLYNAYKQDTKELYERENILDSTYTLDNTGDLLKNGRKVDQDTFLNFIREKLILKQFKELSTSAKITVPEKKQEKDTLTLAFRIFFGRYCLNMAMENNVANKQGMKEWRNHVNVIAELAIYVAVLDQTWHVKYGTCGIEDVLIWGFSLSTDKQFRTDNQNLDEQMPVCATGKKLHNRLFQICVGDSEKRTRETVQIYRLSKRMLRQLEEYLPNFGTNDRFDKKQSDANKTVNVFHGVPWKRQRYKDLYDKYITDLNRLGNDYFDKEKTGVDIKENSGDDQKEITWPYQEENSEEDQKVSTGDDQKEMTGEDKKKISGEDQNKITGDHQNDSIGNDQKHIIRENQAVIAGDDQKEITGEYQNGSIGDDKNEISGEDQTVISGNDPNKITEKNQNQTTGDDQNNSIGDDQNEIIGEDQKENSGENQTVITDAGHTEITGVDQNESIVDDHKENTGDDQNGSTGDNQKENSREDQKGIIGDYQNVSIEGQQTEFTSDNQRKCFEGDEKEITGENQNEITGDDQEQITEKGQNEVTGDNQNDGIEDDQNEITGEDQKEINEEPQTEITGDDQRENNGDDQKVIFVDDQEKITGEDQKESVEENQKVITGDNKKEITKEDKKVITVIYQRENSGEDQREITGDHLNILNEDSVLKILKKLKQNQTPKDLFSKVEISFKIFLVLIFMLSVNPTDKSLQNDLELFALYTSILSSSLSDQSDVFKKIVNSKWGK